MRPLLIFLALLWLGLQPAHSMQPTIPADNPQTPEKIELW